MDTLENTVELLPSGDLRFVLDDISAVLDPREAERILLLGLTHLGWKMDVDNGLQVGNQEPKAMPDVLIRDTLERIRASGLRPPTALLARRSITAPWMTKTEHDAMMTKPVARQRRFTKEKAVSPKEIRKQTAAKRAAVRAPEVVETRLFADPQEQLRYEIRHAYLTSVPLTQREEWPFPETYVLMPSFLRDIESQHGAVSRAQILAACVDVLSGRMVDVGSRQAKMFRVGTSRSTPTVTRSFDGAVAWRASVSNIAAAARRIMWWRRRDGIIELARLAVHDDMEMPER